MNNGRRALAAGLMVAVTASGCGGSDDEPGSGDPAADSVAGPEPAVEPEPTVAPESTETDPPAAAPPDLTSADVCGLFDAAAAGAALGLIVDSAEPADATGTPQCAYTFTGADGVMTNATVAAQRADGDLGGRVGADAYDFVVELNRSMAAGTEVTESAVAAGAQGVVLHGEALHLGVVQTGGRIVNTIVTTGAAEPAAVVAFTEAAATALAP